MSRNNSDFEIVLDSSPLKFFNMNESVLVDKDFISTPSQLSNPDMIKNFSFFYIENTDESFVRQTTHEMHRFNENNKSWLLILAQLKGENIYDMPEEDKKRKADELYSYYLQENNCKLSEAGILTNEEYIQINIDLRTKILGRFSIKIENVPTLEKINETVSDDVMPGVCKLADGKLFFAVISKG